MKSGRVREMMASERAWKLVVTGAGVLGAVVAKKLMGAGYRAVRRDTAPVSPFDPTDVRFAWSDALVWAAAAGIGLGITKIVSARLAAIGWKAVAGAPPPGVETSAV